MSQCRSPVLAQGADTSQLILALASPAPFDDLRSGIGGLAHETLQRAQDQLGSDVAMALTGLVLQ